MGNEFLFKTEDSFRKDHDRARMKLSEPDLFPVITKDTMTVAAKPVEGFRFGEGEVYELITDGSRIALFLDRAPVGFCHSPPQSLVAEINAGGGRAVGTLHRRRRHGGGADIAVIVDP